MPPLLWDANKTVQYTCTGKAALAAMCCCWCGSCSWELMAAAGLWQLCPAAGRQRLWDAARQCISMLMLCPMPTFTVTNRLDLASLFASSHRSANAWE